MISNRYKLPAVLLLLTGITLTAVYSFHRAVLTMPVIAVYSSYLDTRFFTIIKTNFFEELILLSYFAGFLLMAFSKERTEHEEYGRMRLEAWRSAILINTAILVFGTLFFYGKGFIMLLIFNMFSVFLLYLIIFKIKKRKFTRAAREQNPPD